MSTSTTAAPPAMFAGTRKLVPGILLRAVIPVAATFGSGAAGFGSVMVVSSVSFGSVGWVVAGVAASSAGVWVLSVIGGAPCGVGASRR